MTNNHTLFELRQFATPLKCRVPADCVLLGRSVDTALTVGGVNLSTLLARQPEAIRAQVPV